MQSLGEKGFSVVEAILIVIVISLLGAVGWFVYVKQQNRTNDTSSSRQTNQQQQDTSEEIKVCNPEIEATTGYEVYTISAGKMCFLRPISWKDEDLTNQAGIQITFMSPDFKEQTTDGGPSKITNGAQFWVNATDAEEGYDTVDFLKEDNGYYFIYEKDYTVDGLPAVYGFCGHYDPGICVYVAKDGYMYDFMYEQVDKGKAQITTSLGNEYLDEFTRMLESVNIQ